MPTLYSKPLQPKVPGLRQIAAFYVTDKIHLSHSVQQNKLIEAKIQRRLSRVVLKKKKSTELLKAVGPPNASGGLAPPDLANLAASVGLTGSMLGNSFGAFPSSLGPSSSHGPTQFLRIRIADMADTGHTMTTIPAYVLRPCFFSSTKLEDFVYQQLWWAVHG